MKNRKLSIRMMFYILSLLIVIVWLIPFFITTFTSLKSMDEIMASTSWWKPPQQLVWENFANSWEQGNMKTYFRNTFIITVPSVIGTLFVSSLGAFSLSFYKFKMSKIVLIIFVAGMLIPFQMLLIPVYKFSQQTGLYDTFQGVILFHVAFQLGFCTFFLRNFMIGIPKSIFESAKMDGANDFTLYRKIALPLSLPAMAALGILEFTWIWNDYLWALILLQSDSLKPVTLGLVNLQGQWVTSWNIISAASLIAAIVPLVVFLLFQRYFIDGLTVGAVKG
ncbi:carbohydrate ABC transporter permease [Geotoga petraea]|jgi:multiple sugar transport system permease protein|uniref:Carbohydrate ABC transporter membrane protein 2, CUT1 family n=1 Tax=Geotoga petraea TaxID=28234 RepID=A0A1G6M1Q3_9BACT|nr:carbohydrate ABC transporter permease [Geotoga petraea]MDK2946623.1 multiple sugar transport system permease protein [Geotoga sp.]TGG87549.1 carbohydrate ABC transporter permease [Geotoga petraea]SDC48876.1 carbohydrate ABC transporter membrane protein 2, CUT1 family [Geotoga petraea]